MHTCSLCSSKTIKVEGGGGNLLAVSVLTALAGFIFFWFAYYYWFWAIGGASVRERDK